MMLEAELTAHRGYEAGAAPPSSQANRRNGGTTKRVKGLDGEMPLTVPRDRDGSFEPELVKKGQTRIDGIDDKSERIAALLGPMADIGSLQDVLIAVADGLKGFPEAITAAFPQATVQTCVRQCLSELPLERHWSAWQWRRRSIGLLHLVRHSLNFVRRENSVPQRCLTFLIPKIDQDKGLTPDRESGHQADLSRHPHRRERRSEPSGNGLRPAINAIS